jgi:hypothetical protein
MSGLFPASPKTHIELRELLSKFLKHTPTAREADPLIGDLRRMNPYLLKDTLIELENGTANHPGRPEIIAIYIRKTKEQAALYPLLFFVENALRARLAIEMYEKFRVDDWWKDILAAMRAGKDPWTVQAINGVRISRYMAERVSQILSSYDGTTAGAAKLDAMTCGTELLSPSTFGQLRYLVEKSWTEFKHIFAGSKGVTKAISKEEFKRITKVIVDVRNDLYHHNAISGPRQTFVNCCEIIADHLDGHLGSFDAAIGVCVYSRPTFLVAVHAKHHV